MSRAYMILTQDNRHAAVEAVTCAPNGYQLELAEAPRSNPQNSLMWALLQCFANQVEHHGRHHDRETWKCILMNAFGKEFEFVPSLDGESIVALGYRSSHLSKGEMNNFIEFIYATGAERGVVFDREPVALRALPAPLRALPAP
jgi:hypothetical protein